MKRIVATVIITTILMTSLTASAEFPVDGNFIGFNSQVAEPFSQYDNKVVLIEAFATWCQPCKQEFYEFSKLHSAFGQNLSVLSLSVDPVYDNLDKIAKFKAESEELFDFSATWDIGLTISGQTNQQTFNYVMGVNLIPTTLLVDEKGNIVKKWEGVVEADLIGKYIDANVTFPESNPSSDLLIQITSNIYFRLFMVLIVILIVYQFVIPKNKN